MSTTVYVAVGSNISPEANIQLALRLLEQRFGRLVISPSYRTAPWGVADQAPFLNLVVGLQADESPEQVFTALQEMEAVAGRVRGVRNGPRTLDLDLLLYGAQVLNTPRLVVPHPGLLERDFMLEPLLDVAPQIVHPVAGLPIAALRDRIAYRQILERVEGS